MNKLIFSKRLKELMSENKTTQQDLANKTNMTRQAISQHAVGSTLSNIEKLYLISQYFSVSTDFLLGLSNYRKLLKSKRVFSTGKCEEIVLNLKLNTYKQLKNILHNEFKMSKEKIQELVRAQVLDCMENIITVDESWMDKIFKERLEKIINGKFNKGGLNYTFDSLLKEMIVDKYKKVIDEKVNAVVTKEVLKEYFKDK